MRDVAELALPWIVSTWAIFALLRWDERRMTAEQRARAWPDVSRMSAVVVFGVFCLPIHFIRTRRTLRARLLGVAFAVAIALLSSVIELAVDIAFDALS